MNHLVSPSLVQNIPPRQCTARYQSLILVRVVVVALYLRVVRTCRVRVERLVRLSRQCVPRGDWRWGGYAILERALVTWCGHVVWSRGDDVIVLLVTS